ncbi:hypothetical protein LTR17_011841 [Elasticomyces elasticus]|nr:hypothetical protein LTR17_011841 [Elasticomyces elasticus]
MSKTLRAGLAWGTPIKPDQLITNLAAYKRTLPALTTLRLAHRFGQGPQAHITKLPVEMLLLIEDFVIEARRDTNVWDDGWDPYDTASNFACFESRCAPSHHWVEPEDLWDDAHARTTECKSCQEAPEGLFSNKACHNRCTKHTVDPCQACGTAGMGAEDCERSCLAAYEENIELVGQELEYSWDAHEQQKSAWLERIDKTKKGAFLTHKKMLKQHFGLEVYLANTVVDGNNEERWPKYKNYRWNNQSELQTTLCYLTLPKRLGPKGAFDADDRHIDTGTSPDAAQAIQVDMHSLSITDEQRRRFQRALKTLGLMVYFHPSQAHAYTATPDLSLEEDSDEESGSDDTNGIQTFPFNLRCA